MPNYATEVKPGIWRWEGQWYWCSPVDKHPAVWHGPFNTQSEAELAATQSVEDAEQ